MLEIHVLVSWLLDWLGRRRRRRHVDALEALERAEAAADRALFSADPGFAAELGYQPAPFPEPARKRIDARSAAFAAAMQNQQLSSQYAAQMQAMQAQMQGQQLMQQLGALGIGFGGAGQLGRQQAGMLGNALHGGLIGQALSGLGNAGLGNAGLFGNGLQQVTLRQTGRFTMAPMTPLQEAPKDPNVGAALDGLLSLYCAETVPCTCGAPETRDPTFHHGYCAIWQRKA